MPADAGELASGGSDELANAQPEAKTQTGMQTLKVPASRSFPGGMRALAATGRLGGGSARVALEIGLGTERGWLMTAQWGVVEDFDASTILLERGDVAGDVGAGHAASGILALAGAKQVRRIAALAGGLSGLA